MSKTHVHLTKLDLLHIWDCLERWDVSTLSTYLESEMEGQLPKFIYKAICKREPGKHRCVVNTDMFQYYVFTAAYSSWCESQKSSVVDNMLWLERSATERSQWEWDMLKSTNPKFPVDYSKFDHTASPWMVAMMTEHLL